MSKELIIDVASSDIYIALLENRQLVELNKDKFKTQFSVGDIYFGRVKKLLPGLNASFVDIGSEKDAFLHYLDLGPQFQSFNKFVKTVNNSRYKAQKFNVDTFSTEKDIDKHGKITDVLTPGQSILVQIAKEPISTKGPRLSSEISIAGRNIVLLPFSDKISISQKIKSREEKNRLKNLVTSILPKNFGVIVRTVAESKKVADLDTELRQLLDKWDTCVKNIRDSAPPKLLMGEINRATAILRDILNSSFNNIYVNNEIVYNEIKDYINTIEPDKGKMVKLYNGREPLFENFGIEKQIKALFGKTVSLKAGAYLIIERTEALCAIDVNSGQRSKVENNQEASALEVNKAAAEEIARQLRLRDIGGIIVIDFIDLHGNENKMAVYEKMKEAMANDRAKHQILPLSKFCIMQITRQRVRPEMNLSKIEACPTCRGTGEITPSIILIDEIENNLSYIAGKFKDSFTLKAHPFVAAFINVGIPSLKTKWRIKYRRLFRVKSEPSYNFLEFHFFDSAGEEILK